MQMTLPARKPFNFLSVVNSHGWRQLAPFGYDEAAQTLTYVDQLTSGRVVEYRICPAPEGVLVDVPRLAKKEQAEVSQKVTWMFGLDQDFSPFYHAARGESKLANAKRLAHGRVLRSPSLFEDTLKTILTTNTLWSATRRMTLNLVEQYGAPLVEDNTKRAFPTPQSIAASTPEILRQQVRVGYRAPAIHELAVRLSRGDLDLEALKHSSMPTLELRQELLKIKGVGPYAAANLLLILGRSDFIPIDSWALKLVSHEWFDGESVTPRQVEQAFERWGEFKGLAFWFWDWKYKG